MVFISTWFGFYAGLVKTNQQISDYNNFFIFSLIFGAICSSSGVAALNEYYEADFDKLMDRTKNRPIPAGIISKQSGLLFGITMSLIGIGLFWFFVHKGAAILSAITLVLYVFIYTPSKTRSKWNTIIGSFPGALPPVGGWTAATGEIQTPALILFSILFCWQMPHFLSLAIIYKDDYKKAGFKMLPSISKNLDSTLFQIIFFTVALIVSSIGIYLLNLTSFVYMLGAVLLGIIFLLYSSNILFEQSNKKVRKLFIFSIIYLPLLMILIILDTLLI